MLTHIFEKDHVVTEKDVKEVLFKKKWSQYRLGDACISPYAHKLDKVIPRYPSSIAKAWFEEMKRKKWKDIKQPERYRHFAKFVLPYMEKVAKAFYEKYEIDIKKEYAFHLRLGDPFRDLPGEKGRIYNNRYVTKYEKVERMIQLMQKNNVKRVFIFAGFHSLEGKWRRNITYFQKIKEIFQKYEMEYRIITCEPDVDFCLMAAAKTFIVSGGGYSALIQHVRKANGHFIPQEDKPFFDAFYEKEFHLSLYRQFNAV